jgi:DNA (cytosine-5)-methyltransferase 1
MGRAPKDGEVVQAIGNFSGVGIVRAEWDVPWMNRDGIREAVPPAYGQYVGRQFLAAVDSEAAA